jgi:hypothetical protein
LLIVSSKSSNDLDSILSIFRTSVVVVIMVLGALLFSNDANKYIVIPIESMLVKVRRIIEYPLKVG